VRSPLFLPCLLSLVLIAAVAVHYWQLLPDGTIRHGDEYLTLDRSNSFLVRDDWLTVLSENRPTFKKPPLQYWMSAWLMQQGHDLEFALRLPSYLFGIALLASVGALAYLLSPATPWVILAAVALLAGSTRFWESAISALLDTGAALFATLAMTGCLLALRQPRWWYLVAVATGLAAWQKAPVPILLVAGMLVFLFARRRQHDIDIWSALRNRHFAISMLLTVGLVLSWPALQWARHGIQSLHEAYLGQMLDRFKPVGEEVGRQRTWHSVLLNGESVLRVPAVLALLVLPRVLRRPELAAFPFLLIGFVVLVALSTGYVSPRYSIVFLPLLAAALAVALVAVLPGRILPVVVIAALALSSGGPFRSAASLGIDSSSQATHMPMLRGIARSLGEGETLVVCHWGPRRAERIHAGAVSVFASNGRPYLRVAAPGELARLEREGRVVPPYRGLCTDEQFAQLEPRLSDITVVEAANGYVHWRSAGTRR